MVDIVSHFFHRVAISSTTGLESSSGGQQSFLCSNDLISLSGGGGGVRIVVSLGKKTCIGVDRQYEGISWALGQFQLAFPVLESLEFNALRDSRTIFPQFSQN